MNKFLEEAKAKQATEEAQHADLAQWLENADSSEDIFAAIYIMIDDEHQHRIIKLLKILAAGEGDNRNDTVFALLGRTVYNGALKAINRQA